MRKEVRVQKQDGYRGVERGDTLRSRDREKERMPAERNGELRKMLDT